MLVEEAVPTVESNNYSVAGWLSIIMAILLIPEIALSAIAGIELLLAPLRVINLLIGIFVLYTFRQLLNDRFAFSGVNTLISILIVVSILFFLAGMIGLLLQLIGAEDSVMTSSFLILGAFVPYCLLQVVYGWKLLKMPGDLYGLLRPYAHTQIAGGILGATILGAILALPIVAISLVIQGMILLRARQQEEIL